MIKKIICPTDFSSAATNAVEYAQKIAQVFGAELLFVNVQRIMPVSASVSLGDGIGAGVRENSLIAAKKLKELSLQANTRFKILANYEVDVTTESLVKIFSSLATDDSMIVMGTNGADDMYQYFFGSNTYQVIKNAKCPVLVVPENITYSAIQKIVFAWDYGSKSKFSFSMLNDFMKVFNPEFVFFHVSKQQSELSREVFNALKNEIEEVLGNINNVEFKQIFSDNIPESINEYMANSNADMLSITYYDRGFIGNVFHGTVAKKLSGVAKYPLLVLHA